MSEEFGGRLPTEILAEARRLPAGLLDRIVEYRQLARAIAIAEQNPHAQGVLVDVVKEAEFELVAEEIAAKRKP